MKNTLYFSHPDFEAVNICKQMVYAMGARMKTIELKKQKIYYGNLILVNRSHPLPEASKPYATSLVSVHLGHPEILMDYTAAKQLSQTLLSLECGSSIIPVSGYRTMGEQEQIYRESIKENGILFTEKYVALPGHSEHQTGLAIDLAENKEEVDFIRPYFPYTGVCKKFREASVQYGFIERYPKGKEKITGIAHEAWHFRYVGYPHSEIMVRKNFTLEEYVQYIKNFNFKREHLEYYSGDDYYEIFYIKMNVPHIALQLLENATYQISGNNEDGFIITQCMKIKKGEHHGTGEGIYRIG